MTYVTRANVHVDRCASAWLIRRFIDSAAEFTFVEVDAPLPEGAIPFDMEGAEWGHRGHKCTFETLIEIHHLDDPVLGQLAEIIHGADFVDDFDASLESPGIDLLMRGLRLTAASDHEALIRGELVMDALYQAIAQGYRR